VRRFGWLGVLLVIVLVFSACGSGKKIGDDGGLNTSTSAPTQTTADVCSTTTPTATEVGVSPTTITVSVIADTGSSIRPGLFQGSVDGVKAWADYINANGGLACRQVVVKALDSKLSGDDAQNSITTACGDSLALVGTTALFLDNMAPVEQCKDKTGKATGMPDLAVLQTYAAQQCSPVSWPALTSSASCPYSGEGVREFKISTTTIDYYLEKYGKDALHGVYLIPKDLPSTIAATTPLFAADKQEGIKEDKEFGISALDPQSAYTPAVQAIKTNKSTFARNGADYASYVAFRKEAQVQGVDTVKVWDCSLQCYDQRLISSGGSAVEDQYVWLSFLPFEDKGHNDELDAFLQYNKKPDAFGAQAWVAGEIFAEAVRAVVAKDGPNGLTRQAVLDAVANIHDFDAGGFIAPTDIGGRVGTNCLIGVQVQNGKFVRVDPVEPGKFDCRGRVITLKLDPVKAYKG
jgi:ABC-type branched-subunit amino acid transport system substrate-binding protein